MFSNNHAAGYYSFVEDYNNYAYNHSAEDISDPISFSDHQDVIKRICEGILLLELFKKAPDVAIKLHDVEVYFIF